MKIPVVVIVFYFGCFVLYLSATPWIRTRMRMVSDFAFKYLRISSWLAPFFQNKWFIKVLVNIAGIRPFLTINNMVIYSYCNITTNSLGTSLMNNEFKIRISAAAKILMFLFTALQLNLSFSFCCFVHRLAFSQSFSSIMSNCFSIFCLCVFTQIFLFSFCSNGCSSSSTKVAALTEKVTAKVKLNNVLF